MPGGRSRQGLARHDWLWSVPLRSSPTLLCLSEPSDVQPGAFHSSWQQIKTAKASSSRHKHTLAVYVPVASATEEKSLNRLPPFVFFWCSMSSIRWAGITICFFIMSAKARVAPEGSLQGREQLCWHTFSIYQIAAGAVWQKGCGGRQTGWQLLVLYNYSQHNAPFPWCLICDGLYRHSREEVHNAGTEQRLGTRCCPAFASGWCSHQCCIGTHSSNTLSMILE